MDKEIIFSKEEAFIGSLIGIVTVPSDYDPEKEKLPVIVFLHGAGEVGNGTAETVEKVKVHGIPKYFCRDNDYLGLRVITVSPQCPSGLIWDQITLQLMDYINAIIDKFNGDRSHIALTGLSMGGFGTWNLITTFPEFFCCAAPICGGGVSWRANEKLKGKKIRVFHSVDDGAVPFTCSVDMVKKVIASGADVEFTSYTNEGHGCWDRAYEKTDLIKWLATV